jgi:carbonic anhydrase/acetyltransferase-like protein (isoleucine patch superfamily)
MAPSKSPAGDLAVTGNLLVADGARLEGNLRCDGHARIGKGAEIDGDVDVGGSLVVRAEARIRGAVKCAADVDWHPSARAESLRCEGELRVGGHRIATALEAPGGIAAVTAEEGTA